MAETSFDIIDGVCYVSTDERKWIGKIMRLSKENEGVKVLRKPEQNDGCLYCQIPSEWVKIGIPRHLNLSDEEREKRRNRLAGIMNDE